MNTTTQQSVERIVVTITENDSQIKKAFEGHWIIGDEDAGETFLFSQSEGIQGFSEYSVAVTKAGRLAVLEHNGEDTRGSMSSRTSRTSMTLKMARKPCVQRWRPNSISSGLRTLASEALLLQI